MMTKLNRIGANPDPVYRVANLASLFTVCALALDAVDTYNDDIRERVTADIKHVLEWGALYADETMVAVERSGLQVEEGGAS